MEHEFLDEFSRVQRSDIATAVFRDPIDTRGAQEHYDIIV